MTITFLAHSGFLVELDHVLLLFDWWKGALPPLPNKPLLVFASHNHADHFKPEVFALDNGSREVHFLLGKDIKLNPAHRLKWGYPQSTYDKCTRLGGNEIVSPMEHLQVETLPSTDAGVAFLVTAEGKTIYHAGDLNWWHWAREPDPWNANMERDYKAYLEPLRGRHIDLAMVPLDPRLTPGEDYGLTYFLELTETDRVLPMHQWEDYSPTERFIDNHPQWAQNILPVTHTGHTFELGGI